MFELTTNIDSLNELRKKQPQLVLYEIILCVIESKKLTSLFRKPKQNCDSNRCKFARNFSLTYKTQTTLTEFTCQDYLRVSSANLSIIEVLYVTNDPEY